MTMLPVANTETRPRRPPLSATSPVTKITPLKFALPLKGMRYDLSPGRLLAMGT